ncbi:putative signal transduction protein with a C-terminal ATPase domain [Thermobacillus composti KWC4]|uniref:Putative signal transduction protein with a C-terminal ATPase domain n=1 Tax=Thermobacillus composti (strain DSM 18247 / JCM 13945 / KWC4) TaxID=717605 RepID=L0EJN4_THECK|nr:sensor histidine kinase [Thermobacillus composti]AGA59430.1 putative signal transduction protein with a C-terminal ATPase domain [Thermobacillus composti KWC4]
MPKHNLFKKIALILFALLVPIVALYVLSNRISTDVLRDELNDSNANRLAFFQHQADTTIQSIALWPNLLIHDPDITELRHTFESPVPSLGLDQIMLVKRIQRKLSIQENSSNWSSRLYIYSPVLGRVVSSSNAAPYDPGELTRRLKPGWHVEPAEGGRYLFSLFTISPYVTEERLHNVNLVIEVQFDSSNLVHMLDQFKIGDRRDPFYYMPGVGAIYNSTADSAAADRLVELLEEEGELSTGSRTVTLDGQPYLVYLQKSDIAEWYLIDYIPLAEVMQPIKRTNLLFYVSVGSLLLMGCVMAYVLYAQVQSPLKQLVTSFQRLKLEDYTVRLKPRGKSEFAFVFQRFNSMVEQIQELFNRVYLERLRVQEARLKQLQSQINPHFFHNSISFISSMAKMKNHQAIIAMAENLSSYFRYATRQERDFVTLEEELQFVGSYLEIHKLRRSRLTFSIELPSRLRHLHVPPLLIQPLAENAVRHGIEANGGEGLIRIAVGEADGVCRVTVDDNGKGLNEEARGHLLRRLAEPMDERAGCGLWNVNQRLYLRYGPDAGMRMEPSPLGGLRIVLEWRLAGHAASGAPDAVTAAATDAAASAETPAAESAADEDAYGEAARPISHVHAKARELP